MTLILAGDEPEAGSRGRYFIVRLLEARRRPPVGGCWLDRHSGSPGVVRIERKGRGHFRAQSSSEGKLRWFRDDMGGMETAFKEAQTMA